ncbi:hypothetical protein RND81_11G051400 [Saponaria officinalis]|uniref:Uncharacterized protein n=1 Tax=Saponaria officinalis TaxID=3572 RepID=A0AAW1HH42_SAPOF
MECGRQNKNRPNGHEHFYKGRGLLAFFFLLTHSVALHSGAVSSLASPPRKLMPVKQKALTTVTKTEIVPGKMMKEASVDGSLEAKKKQIKTETWKKWEEVKEASDLFTMDYRRVRKRQPIHNKSLPFP